MISPAMGRPAPIRGGSLHAVSHSMFKYPGEPKALPGTAGTSGPPPRFGAPLSGPYRSQFGFEGSTGISDPGTKK